MQTNAKDANNTKMHYTSVKSTLAHLEGKGQRHQLTVRRAVTQLSRLQQKLHRFRRGNDRRDILWHCQVRIPPPTANDHIRERPRIAGRQFTSCETSAVADGIPSGDIEFELE